TESLGVTNFQSQGSRQCQIGSISTPAYPLPLRQPCCARAHGDALAVIFKLRQNLGHIRSIEPKRDAPAPPRTQPGRAGWNSNLDLPATTNVNTCEGPPLGIRKAEQNVGVENDPLDPGAHARCRRVARGFDLSVDLFRGQRRPHVSGFPARLRPAKALPGAVPDD